jgi:hypothetical protein
MLDSRTLHAAAQSICRAHHGHLRTARVHARGAPAALPVRRAWHQSNEQRPHVSTDISPAPPRRLAHHTCVTRVVAELLTCSSEAVAAVRAAQPARFDTPSATARLEQEMAHEALTRSAIRIGRLPDAYAGVCAWRLKPRRVAHAVPVVSMVRGRALRATACMNAPPL